MWLSSMCPMTSMYLVENNKNGSNNEIFPSPSKYVVRYPCPTSSFIGSCSWVELTWIEYSTHCLIDYSLAEAAGQVRKIAEHSNPNQLRFTSDEILYNKKMYKLHSISPKTAIQTLLSGTFRVNFQQVPN